MTWDRFGYVCRRACAQLEPAKSVAHVLSEAEHEASANLYGERGAGALGVEILAAIKGLDKREDALLALETYGDLNMPQGFDEPLQLKRVLAYLSYVTFIFYLVLGIYQIKVMPVFLEMFDHFSYTVPDYILWYQSYWQLVIAVISLLLFTALYVAYQLKRAFRLDKAVANSWTFKLLAFHGVRAAYRNLNDIIRYPIARTASSAGGEFTQHLKNVEEQGMSFKTEMECLLRLQQCQLLEQCEKQIKVITTAVALVIVSSIFFFLASAYSPIFMMGDAI